MEKNTDNCFDAEPEMREPQGLSLETVEMIGRLGLEIALPDIDHRGVAKRELESDVITLDLPDLPSGQINALLAERVPATTIRPQLVLPEEVRAPEVYARLGEQEKKDQYRDDLRKGLSAAWITEYGEERAREILTQFNWLTLVIQEDGAAVFGDLIDRSQFSRLVSDYDELMQKDGSISLLHSYANLRNQPEFLANKDFNGAFFHPLAVALISERVGGAVRVVDARAKDAGPISVRAQDNMLHIDNTPYRDEYKILVTWEKGKASGPKGQNFVFLPGTHKGVRDSLIGEDGEVHSTENASIFINPDDVEQVFELQQQVRQGSYEVVEIHDKERPLTTVFPSGSLVHHRLRTEEGYSRSGLIIAFHRTADTPGEFIGNYDQDEDGKLEAALFGFGDADSDTGFSRMLTEHASAIGAKIEEIFAEDKAATLIDAKAKVLTPEDMQDWYEVATGAPTVETIKQQEGYFPLRGELDMSEFVDLLNQMMKHDKHGPIDMILYADGHEEPRKWARNRIREMREDTLRSRINEWKDQVQQPVLSDLLTIDQIGKVTQYLVSAAESVSIEERENGYLDPIERISPQEAYRSVEQLIIDLGENLTRADDRQTYLSAALFQFWACDELNRLQGNTNLELKELGGYLLRNYIATAVLIEKQIENEKMG